jgi:hypothetical protein
VEMAQHLYLEELVVRDWNDQGRGPQSQVQERGDC